MTVMPTFLYNDMPQQPVQSGQVPTPLLPVHKGMSWQEAKKAAPDAGYDPTTRILSYSRKLFRETGPVEFTATEKKGSLSDKHLGYNIDTGSNVLDYDASYKWHECYWRIELP
ncbi:hypothetical protein AWB68_08029 [Caballeronia choica]|uniref:Uncharacterized protein n=1 Tax=Caballeronia choica TaxID=326476 RepID=A0A158KZ68_9BURK|nr:hypothetical protein AWB68_08029 [Caballeronia choica]